MRSLKMLPVFCAVIFIALVQQSSADIPVGIFPLKGDHPKKGEIELSLKDQMQKFKGLSIVAEALMNDIVAVHAKAQSIGSEYLDISKLKTAEYIVVGAFESELLNLKAVDVNSGTELYTKSIDIAKGDYDYQFRAACKAMYNSILLNSSTRNESIPEDAAPYMDTLCAFVKSLKSKDEDLYQYLALYYKGKFQQPAKEDKNFCSSAKVFLNALRPNLMNAKIIFLFLEEETPWTNLIIVTDKNGKKQKHKVGFISREDGSSGIGNYELQN